MVADATLANGTLAIQTLDADGRPVAAVPLAVTDQGAPGVTVATGVTDARGAAKLRVATAGAFVLTATYEGGRFPLSLTTPSAGGARVGLHVYPSTGDIDAARVVFRASVTIVSLADHLYIDETFVALGVSRSAYRASFSLAIPSSAVELTARQEPELLRVERGPTGEVLLRDTIAPGRHFAEVAWKLPAPAGRDAAFDLAMPPHVAMAEVTYATSNESGLEVTGFDPPRSRRSEKGTPALVTEKQFLPTDPALRSIHVLVRGSSRGVGISAPHE
jgi:hypothetical protein